MSETAPERMSVQTFAAELGETIRRYLRTFDPAAPTELQNIRLEVTGANLGLRYIEQGGEPPSLFLSLSRMERLSDLPPITYPTEGALEEKDPRRDEIAPHGGPFWKR